MCTRRLQLIGRLQLFPGQCWASIMQASTCSIGTMRQTVRSHVQEVRAMVAAQTAVLQEEVLPALRGHGIYILSYAELSTTDADR